MLIRDEDRIQKLIYYISHVLQDVETRYSNFAKLIYRLVLATRKLHSYFQAHHVIVMTNQPMQQIFSKPNAMGRLLKWGMELSEFDIIYRPPSTIKAQAIVDLVVEMIVMDEAPKES